MGREVNCSRLADCYESGIWAWQMWVEGYECDEDVQVNWEAEEVGTEWEEDGSFRIHVAA